MIRNNLIFLACFFFSFSAVSAQDDDLPSPPITDTIPVITSKRIDELSKQALKSDLDTGMISLHFYNVAYKESFAPQFLGNTGSAFQNSIFSLRNNQSPFVFANPYLHYFHDPYKRNHFNTRKPFTQVSYVTSGNKTTSEQVMSAMHTQNINQYSNIGIEYDLISSKGIYLNQELKSNRFSLFASHDKENYSIYGNISSNKTKTLENGGILDVPAFLFHQANDPIAYGVSLGNASSAVKNLSLFATQSYRFSKTVTDTTSFDNDTLTFSKEKALPFMINHTIRYDRYTRTYTDSDTSDFYTDNYYNLATAYDSVSRYIFENSFQISGDEYKFLPGFIMGIKHQLTGYNYLYPRLTAITENEIPRDTIVPRDFASNYNNLSVYGMLLFNKKSRISYQGKLEYFFAGYRLNDILTDFSMNYKLNAKGARISAFGKFYATEPDFFLKQYYSSHFQWRTAFPKTKTTSASLSFTSGDGTIYAEGSLSLMDNYIYINDMALPAKADLNILVSSLRLEKKFKWGGFNHIHKFVLQKVNRESYLQLPLMAYGNTSFYENAFFKGVLKFQIGFDFYFNSGYYSDSYMPATGMFYRQNIAKTGEYPFLDGFLNWKVKRTRFFIKYTNALAGPAGYNYFTTYGYPMNPGSLKFGLSWTFYD